MALLRPVRWAAGVIAVFALGCGALNGACGPAAREPNERQRAPGGRQTDGVESAQTARDLAAAEGQIAPAFDEDILAARVQAQQRLLGSGALFEDLQGRPVVPAPGDGEHLEIEVEDGVLDALPGSSGIGANEEAGSNAVNGNALGLFVPMENPRGTSLLSFHRALRRLEDESPDGYKVRVLVYGASHTQADIYTSYLRHYLQARFGNGGRGFVPIAKVNRWHRQPNLRIENADGWTITHAQKRNAPEVDYYGLLGMSVAGARRRNWAHVGPRDASAVADHGTVYELYYLEQPNGGRFQVLVDGKSVATLDSRADTARSGYFAINQLLGAHEIEVRPAGRGEVKVFGVSVENDNPGVVVDTLGISGTRASNMLKWDEATWADSLRRRSPALIMFAYGTNETTDEDQPISHYRGQLRRVLERFKRAAPEASCLLVGPGDFPRKVDEDVWVERPRLAQIVEVQREMAWEVGCGFWDALAFMGGVGSMHVWANSQPRMASRDHIHLTRRGYVRLGMALTDALMVDYDAARP